MKTSMRKWTSLSLAIGLLGCSASTPPGSHGGNGNFTPGSATAGTGGTGILGSGGIGDTGNPNGPIGPTAGTSSVTNVPPPPPVDPSAPPFKQDDTGMAGLDGGTLGKLKAGGGACGVKVTYPYDGTVFPGGLIPPVIMWDGASDSAYVHFAYDMSDKVDYAFAAKTSSPASIQIPRTAWNEITRRTNNLALKVTLNVSSGGAVTTCQLQWKIAAGNMIGAIYYNTYQAPSPGVANEGAVMRQSLGANAEIYKQFTGTENVIPGTGPCVSCHSVSFNGTTMVASYHDYSQQTFRVEKYDVAATTQPMSTGTVVNANFGALTPDGKRILAMGNPQCTAGADSFPRKPNNMPLVEGPAVARVLDTATGMDTMAKGLNKDFYMWMPEFSPDGTKVVFNHAKPDPTAPGPGTTAMGAAGAGGSGGRADSNVPTDRRELATMDYDAATNTFSNLKVIVSADKMPGIVKPSQAYMPAASLAGVLTCGADMCGPDGTANSCAMPGGIPGIGSIPGIPGDVAALPTGSCTGPCYPAWPFFTPDGKAVVYSMISEPDFAQAFPGRDKPSQSELWYVDLDTNQTIRMDAANTALKDVDKISNYYPTVMPVAVGGYFWVFWTAVRDYGNKLAGRDPSANMTAAAEAIKKRIWGVAIRPKQVKQELQDPTLMDPSFPGFYIDGQSESGNVRAFAALNPCLQNGASCTTGLDCCCGYCLAAAGAATGSCTCEVPKCAKINEKCKTTADCCPATKPDDPSPICIGGYCGFVMLN